MELGCNLETGFGPMLATSELELTEPLVKLPNIKVNQTPPERYNCCNDSHGEGNETDDGGKRDMNASKDPNEDWSPSAISSLLDVWGDCYQTLNNGKLQMENWSDIASEVSNRCCRTKAPKDPLQCKLKVKALKRRYNRERMAKRFPPSARNLQQWEWYDVMDAILEGAPHCVMVVAHDPSKDENSKLCEESVASPVSVCKEMKPCDESIVSPMSELHENPEPNSTKVTESSRLDEAKSHLRVKLPKEDEPPIVCATKMNSKVRATKLFVRDSNSSATMTPRSESSYCMKRKYKKTMAFQCDKHRHDREIRMTRALVAAIFRIAKRPNKKTKRKSDSCKARGVQESKVLSACMDFGAMFQQFEKNQLHIMEKILKEQSLVLSEFVKTLKYNNHVREVSNALQFKHSTNLIVTIFSKKCKVFIVYFDQGMKTSCVIPKLML